MRKATVVVVTAVTVAGASIGFGEGWSFRAGPVYREGMEMTLSGPTYSSSQGAMYLPNGYHNSGINEWQRDPRPDAGSVALPADNPAEFKDRSFDNGFVNISPPTEFTGQTWYWGYTSEGQYDGELQILSFTRQGSAKGSGQYRDVGFGTEVRTRSEIQENGESSDESDFNGSGMFAEAGYELFRRDALAVEFVVGMSYVQGSATLEDETYRATVTESTYANSVVNVYSYTMAQSFLETYGYFDRNRVVGLVPVPYAGTYDGPGPLLSDERPSSYSVTPFGSTLNQALTSESSSQTLAGQQTWTIHNHVTVDADVEDTALSMGARAKFTWRDIVSLFVQPDVSLHYVTADLKRREDLYQTSQDGNSQLLASWTDSADDEDWVMGVGTSVGTEISLPKNCFVSASVGYEWMLDKPEFEVGPSTVEIDLSSLQANAAVGVRF